MRILILHDKIVPMNYFKLFIKKTLQYLLKPLTFLPAILIAAMIFGFSSQDAAESSRLSTEVTTTIVEDVNVRLNKGWSPAEIAIQVFHWEFYVRKLAHFSEYALLGIALSIPMYAYHVRKWKLPLSAGLICFIYAALDEFHQNFSYGRSPQFRDVLIDTSGALVGILIGWLISHICARTVFRPLSLENEREIRDNYYRHLENGEPVRRKERPRVYDEETGFHHRYPARVEDLSPREREEFEKWKKENIRKP